MTNSIPVNKNNDPLEICWSQAGHDLNEMHEINLACTHNMDMSFIFAVVMGIPSHLCNRCVEVCK